MAPARSRACLVLLVLAGSQLLTDGHPRGSSDAGASPPRRGPEDADVLLEMLWGGLDLEADGTVRLRDEELASLRPARRFVRVLRDEVPKAPAEIELHLRHYSGSDTPLPPAEFERLLLTSAYCALQIRSVRGLDKNLWIRFFAQLLDETFRDLCKGLCSANTTLLLASWPWEEKPSHLAALKHFYPSNLARTKRST
ncbi:F180B protein, partial [Rhinopomastus cyanomelas]|nr:F180B protein [Rhinopomastus cyanomelas]